MTSKTTVAQAIAALAGELSAVTARADALKTAIKILSGTAPRPATEQLAPASHRRTRRGARQEAVLDAYKKLGKPMEIRTFARSLGGSAKQRRLWAVSVHRQGYLKRMDIRDGVIYPAVEVQ